MIGQTIDGKYIVLRLLGEGGMGAVYEAKHGGTDRRVALKVINDASARRRGTVERFLREAKVVGAVDTQHITQIYDSGTDPGSGCPYIAMELLSGEDCDQLIRRVGPLAPDLALRIAAQACLGLAKAHAAGIIHRDIKPANLYLARRDAGEVLVKILDFGIARSLTDTENSRMTATGAVLGSPSYMSPEQVKGLKTIDSRSDLWSLGACMYEMLTGLVPYHKAETIHTLIMAICSESPPPLQDLAPWVSPEVVGAIEGAMQHDVARRFQGAIAMQDFIRRLLPGGSWTIHEGMLVPLDPRVRTTKAPRRAQAPALGPPAPPDAAVVAGSARPKSLPLVPIAAAIAFAVVGVAGVGLYKVARHREEPGNPAPVGSASSTAPETRTVRVRIPDGASAEVDGAAVSAPGGVIDLLGSPGSRHRVHVFAGDRDAVVEVFVANDGALPDRIDFLPSPASSVATSAASTSAPVQAKPPGRAVPSAVPAAKPTKSPDGITKKFEL